MKKTPFFKTFVPRFYFKGKPKPRSTEETLGRIGVSPSEYREFKHLERVLAEQEKDLLR